MPFAQSPLVLALNMYALNMCVRLISQVCQIQTLFVMLTALVDLFRQQLETAESMI